MNVELIQSLDDATARRALATVARTRMGESANEPPPDRELAGALAELFEVAPGVEGSEGEVARAALLLLAEDPETAQAIEALVVGPSTRSFGGGAEVAIAVAAIVALQTYVRFSRGKDGRWSLVIQKKPTELELLKPLVEKLVALLSK